MRFFKECLKKGTKEQDVVHLATKAQWMMNGGRSSADWNELSSSDVKLLTAYNTIMDEVKYSRSVNAVRDGMYGKPQHNQ